jgi:Zn-dependent peptidase ImmA (M78 family)
MSDDLKIELAAPILYEYYQKFKGKKLSDILNGFPVKIVIRLKPELGFYGASLYTYVRDEWLMHLPANSSEPMRYFLAFHELAHAVLKINGFANVTFQPGYWIQEAWCDNFALALTFSTFGIEVITRPEDAIEFFGATSEAKSGSARNTAMSQRLDGFCNGNGLPSELFFLRQSFIQPTLF